MPTDLILCRICWQGQENKTKFWNETYVNFYLPKDTFYDTDKYVHSVSKLTIEEGLSIKDALALNWPYYVCYIRRGNFNLFLRHVNLGHFITIMKNINIVEKCSFHWKLLFCVIHNKIRLVIKTMNVVYMFFQAACELFFQCHKILQTSRNPHHIIIYLLGESKIWFIF